jgi:hypothetical protein
MLALFERIMRNVYFAALFRKGESTTFMNSSNLELWFQVNSKCHTICTTCNPMPTGEEMQIEKLKRRTRSFSTLLQGKDVMLWL